MIHCTISYIWGDSVHLRFFLGSVDQQTYVIGKLSQDCTHQEAVFMKCKQWQLVETFVPCFWPRTLDAI